MYRKLETKGNFAEVCEAENWNKLISNATTVVTWYNIAWIVSNKNYSLAKDLFPKLDIQTPDYQWANEQIIKSGDKELIKLYIKSGAPVKGLFASAIYNKNYALLKEFVNMGIDLNKANDNPLYTAVVRKDVEAVKILLNAGADPEVLISGSLSFAKKRKLTLKNKEKHDTVTLLFGSILKEYSIYEYIANEVENAKKYSWDNLATLMQIEELFRQKSPNHLLTRELIRSIEFSKTNLDFIEKIEKLIYWGADTKHPDVQINLNKLWEMRSNDNTVREWFKKNGWK